MYVPLYVKTEYSMLNSLVRISSLVDKALKNNVGALTITDNNMYGVMEFYHKCLAAGIKPIVGLEVRLDDLIFVLYCKNYNGYKNLIKISTMMSDGSLNFEKLKNLCSDLICIVSCKYMKFYDDLSSIYSDIYIGYSCIEEERNLSYDNLVYMNEILYLEKNDSEFYKYLIGIRDGILYDKIINDKNNNYFVLEDELCSKKYLKNNYKIFDSCNLVIDFNLDLLPLYDCGTLDSYTYLKKLCVEGLKKIFGNSVLEKYRERLKYELDVINKMGFCNYFLVVADYVKFAHDNGILVGPGRGSAVGSLVSYCLNITSIDPLKYNLLFERFLNPERVSMPDIDIDFEFDRRDEVIDYCREKYGFKNVAPIITFGTLGTKQVIRDVGRVMDIDLSVIDKLSRMLDSNFSLEENYKSNLNIKSFIDKNNEVFKLFRVCSKLEGLKRHKTIHAAGVVISKLPLDEVIPLDMHQDGFYLTGYSMEYLEKIGLLKMDFLALKNLSIINDILHDIDSSLSFDSIPCDDLESIEMLASGYTSGIFQFETAGMTNFIKKLKPKCFEDLVAAVALFRPGPMQNIDSFIRRRNGQEKIDYIHENLRPILSYTYGIIVYQEQIMQIARVLAGFSLGEADILRKAMSKKNRDVVLKMKDKFINQSISRGYDSITVNKVFNFILKFAEYGFNKAHSVSYVVLALKMAYLKKNYGIYFMKNLLSSNIGSDSKIKDLIYECKQIGINVRVPDINLSDVDYRIVNDSIIFPLSSIKNVGKNIANVIVSNRKEGYKDIFDFVLRNYNNGLKKDVVINLNHAGCFDSLGYTRREIDDNLELVFNYAEIGMDDESLRPILKKYDDYSNFECMRLEQEVIGMYLSKHPVTEYKAKYNSIGILDVPKYFDKFIDIVVLVDRVREVNTKDNSSMCFITGSDEVSSIDIVMFPKIFSMYSNIVIGDIVKINGKVEKRFDKYQIIVNKLEKVVD